MLSLQFPSLDLEASGGEKGRGDELELKVRGLPRKRGAYGYRLRASTAAGALQGQGAKRGDTLRSPRQSRKD